ncbi:carbohydrate ABC transporter permease [Paenibacillus sp. GSMTC-2017]|uniref:carbohydrate ABC transporter permease n=1 Tax=Paenibacillus sp. GSMTC-2017 TaxID=2794350 RepID=UPI0018D69B1B|nr:carbohydrate ABC transporter permease [Paenibacillus sp. GSMTC-2017]MBH5318912.1 carbohydrate ABC transporter permease [Paenibacillus sp. GSMTC-2017]
MKLTKKESLVTWIVRLLLLLWTVAVVYPLVWTLLSSLKNNKQFYGNKPWSLPEFPLQWSNFSYVWTEYKFAGYFFNSVAVTVASTALALLLSAMTAYVIARYPFKGSNFLYFIYISAMMIPIILSLIPLFFLLDGIGLTNNLLGLILVYGAGALPFGIFVLVSFYKSLPKEMEEAAAIDGSSEAGTFFRIMLPLSKPGLITVAIMNVLTIWNEYILGTIIMNDPMQKIYTLPVAIAVMQGEMQYRTEWGPLFAALVISMVPIIIVYSLFQKQITGGITAGAVK